MRIQDAAHTTYFRHRDGATVPATEALINGRTLRAGYGLRPSHSPYRSHDAGPVTAAIPLMMNDSAATGGKTKMQFNDTLSTELPGISGRTRQAIAALKVDHYTGLESGLRFARDHLRQIKDAAANAKAGTVNDAAVTQVATHLEAHIDAAQDRLRGMAR